MNRAVRFTAVAVVVLGVAVQAHAAECGGYPGVKWGASLATLKKLYPHGGVKREVSGRVVYFVGQVIAMRDALVSFTLMPKKGVTSVQVGFPKGDVDLKTGRGIFESTEEAKQTYSWMEVALTSKYGMPTEVPATAENPPMALWCNAQIGLNISKGELPDTAEVTVTYMMPNHDTASGL